MLIRASIYRPVSSVGFAVSMCPLSLNQFAVKLFGHTCTYTVFTIHKIHINTIVKHSVAAPWRQTLSPQCLAYAECANRGDPTSFACIEAILLVAGLSVRRTFSYTKGLLRRFCADGEICIGKRGEY